MGAAALRPGPCGRADAALARDPRRALATSSHAPRAQPRREGNPPDRHSLTTRSRAAQISKVVPTSSPPSSAVAAGARAVVPSAMKSARMSAATAPARKIAAPAAASPAWKAKRRTTSVGDADGDHRRGGGSGRPSSNDQKRPPPPPPSSGTTRRSKRSCTGADLLDRQSSRKSATGGRAARSGRAASAPASPRPGTRAAAPSPVELRGRVPVGRLCSEHGRARRWTEEARQLQDQVGGR